MYASALKVFYRALQPQKGSIAYAYDPLDDTGPVCSGDFFSKKSALSEGRQRQGSRRCSEWHRTADIAMLLILIVSIVVLDGDAASAAPVQDYMEAVDEHN